MAILSAAEIRAAVTGLADDTKYPDATLERFEARFSALAGDYLGIAVETTETTETVASNGHAHLLPLSHEYVTEVSAISYDVGTAPTTAEVTIQHGSSLALVPAYSYWPDARQVTVTYTHGYETTPPALIDACIEYVRAEALQQAGSQPRNVTGERTDLGWIPEPTADVSKGRPTRWNVVNEALNSLQRTALPGVA